MKLNRRSLLKTTLKTAGAGFIGSSGLFPTNAFARNLASAEDHFFVVVEMSGGWDITLGLDPWTNSVLPNQSDMYIEYSPNDIIAHAGLKFGPAASPLIPYMDRMATINGIFMSDKDNGHVAGLNYMLTGQGSGSPSLEVELAHAKNKAGTFGILTDTTMMTLNRNISITELDGVYNAYESKQDGSSLKSFLDQNNPQTALARAQQFLANSSNQMKDLFKKIENLQIDANPDLRDAKLLAASFLTKTSFSGHLSLTSGNLDTHSNHVGNHLNAQRRNWKDLANILNLFKTTSFSGGESLLDRTTFLVVSDFSRTPFLNNANGKDHNPMTNSALLIGKGIKAGVTIGESKLVTKQDSNIGTAYHIAKPYDYTTGQVLNQRVDGSKFITPENIAMTLATLFKVDLNRFDSIPKGFDAIKGILS